MSKSIKAIIALGFVTVVAACGGKQEEEVVYIDEPVVVEETMSKY